MSTSIFSRLPTASQWLGSRLTDHYADAVFSEPGRCWRMVHDGEGSGRPTFCEEPVTVVGTTRLAGPKAKRIRVWSCDGHRAGVEQPERLDHR